MTRFSTSTPGGRAFRFVISPAVLYSGNRAALERTIAGTGRFAHERKLSRAVAAPHDFLAELPDEDRREAARTVRAAPDFDPVYEQNGISVLRIR